MFDADDRLLYVGISLSAVLRFTQHKATARWHKDVVTIKIEKHPTRAAALQAEADPIRTEKPVHNIACAGPKPRNRRSVRVATKEAQHDVRAAFALLGLKPKERA